MRRARAEDAPAIADLLQAAFREHEASFTPAAFAFATPPAETVRARLAEGPIWVGEEQGRLLGTVSAVASDVGVYLRQMAVHPAARGRGIGDRLVAEVERFAKEVGAQRIYLSTTPFMQGAIRCYERHGFVRTAEGPHDLLGSPLFTMERRL